VFLEIVDKLHFLSLTAAETLAFILAVLTFRDQIFVYALAPHRLPLKEAATLGLRLPPELLLAMHKQVRALHVYANVYDIVLFV